MEIPKDNGRTRPLGIPTVKDRIVQTAMKLVIEPIFETMFPPSSYGFRPGRGCKDALREADRLIRDGYAFVVDADLQSYFSPSVQISRAISQARFRCPTHPSMPHEKARC